LLSQRRRWRQENAFLANGLSIRDHSAYAYRFVDQWAITMAKTKGDDTPMTNQGSPIVHPI
jgi:hypothetical protein